MICSSSDSSTLTLSSAVTEFSKNKHTASSWAGIPSLAASILSPLENESCEPILQKTYLYRLNLKIQWELEYGTPSVFRWSKPVWLKNGSVFGCHSKSEQFHCQTKKCLILRRALFWPSKVYISSTNTNYKYIIFASMGDWTPVPWRRVDRKQTLALSIRPRRPT